MDQKRPALLPLSSSVEHSLMYTPWAAQTICRS